MKKFFILIISLFFSNCAIQQSKINGISFVGSPKEITATSIDPIIKIHASWAAVMPFGYLRTLDNPNVIISVKNQWRGEKHEGAKKTIELLHDRGIKVMLKPQIWVWGGDFTGNIKMKSETDWTTLEKTYEDFILLYARLATEMKIPLFCIGTELHTFVQQRPIFWNQLISKIRIIYKGNLTYAENWDQFEKVPFWDQLNFIGIDAYFPVSEYKSPSIEQIKKGWQHHKAKISTLQSKLDKQILFTEYGYRSVHYTGKKPWDTNDIKGNVDMNVQINALVALHQEFLGRTVVCRRISLEMVSQPQ